MTKKKKKSLLKIFVPSMILHLEQQWWPSPKSQEVITKKWPYCHSELKAHFSPNRLEFSTRHCDCVVSFSSAMSWHTGSNSSVLKTRTHRNKPSVAALGLKISNHKTCLAEFSNFPKISLTVCPRQLKSCVPVFVYGGLGVGGETWTCALS